MRKRYNKNRRRTLDRRLAEELMAKELRSLAGGGNTGATFDSGGNEND